METKIGKRMVYIISSDIKNLGVVHDRKTAETMANHYRCFGHRGVKVEETPES